MQAGAVEVWTARPDELGCDACTQLMAVLDTDERERAARLRWEEDRRGFVVAHAMRRMALGLALAMDPHDLQFGTSPHGQPVLLGIDGAMPSFSLSRSRGLVAFAMGAGSTVGIDVEAMRDGVDGALLAPYVALAEPGIVQTEEDFYVQWTALEAFWKARGLGLSAAHPRIRLEPVADDCWEVVFADAQRPAGMVVMRLPAGPGHVLALACDALVPVRIVELDGLARAPQAQPQKALSSCKNSHCVNAAAPNILSA
jgi:phosphopantetheinyl transferase